MENTELTASLFTAFEQGDEAAVRALCSTELTAIQNHAPPMNLDTLLDFSLAVRRVVTDFRYEDAIRTPTAEGCVEEHLVRGTLPDGSELRMSACVIAEISEGKIRCLREYVDGWAARGLMKALADPKR